MERFKRILVCIDQPETDGDLLAYAGGRSKLARTQEVHFLHIATEPPIGDDAPGKAEASPPMTVETLAALVERNFKGHGDEQLA